MTRSIYALSLQGLEIEELLLESAGAITPEIEDKVDALLVSGPETIESAAAVVTQLMMSAKMAEEESDRLRSRAKEFEDQAGALKERMVLALDRAFGGKVKTPKWTVWTQTTGNRTVAELIPGVTPQMLYEERPDLVRVKMELDRVKVIAHLKEGKPLPELILFEEKEGERRCHIK